MEMFTVTWWSALLSIVLIDLVLAGDNAILIALAARQLPAPLKRKAILWGSLGAIAVRAVMTLAAVWLLQIPGLMAAGGLCLLWIAYRLLADGEGDAHQDASATTLMGAMKTIIVADALMGVDNVLGVAGAAHGAFELVIAGLLLSVPIVVYGSSIVLRLVERYPAIIHVGAAVLAWTAAKMVVSEPWLAEVFGATGEPLLAAQAWARGATYVAAVAGVLAAGWWAQRQGHA